MNKRQKKLSALLNMNPMGGDEHRAIRVEIGRLLGFDKDLEQDELQLFVDRVRATISRYETGKAPKGIPTSHALLMRLIRDRLKAATAKGEVTERLAENVAQGKGVNLSADEAATVLSLLNV